MRKRLEVTRKRETERKKISKRRSRNKNTKSGMEF